ncbi:unnamed protein product, partial [marine sediment metagenome]
QCGQDAFGAGGETVRKLFLKGVSTYNYTDYDFHAIFVGD